MNREDIIRMARESGIDAESDTLCRYEGWVEPLERFAALVAAHEREKFTSHAAALVRDARQDAIERELERRTFELAESYRCGWDGGVAAKREACAKVCEEHWKHGWNAMECADAIRARGKE